MASGDHAHQGLEDGGSQGCPEPTAVYLDELVKEARALDQLQCQMSLRHTRALLTREVERVWKVVYKQQTERHNWSGEQTETIKLEEKVWVPVDEYPSFNFIGRILGPRGMSVKQMEQESGCKILVRGRGSVKDCEREQRLAGKSGWEHLDEPLHILISAQDTPERAAAKLDATVRSVKRLLCPIKNDDFKRRQLMELAIINGTYRPTLRRHDRNSD